MNRHYSFHNIFLVLIASCALVLIAEDLLRTHAQQSLCPTEACHVVGGYVRWGEATLRVAGIFFFCLLWALLFFAGRYDRKWLWGGLTLTLMAGLAFDGGLLGFQFLSLQTWCAICVAVAAGLLVCLAGLAWLRRSWLILFLGLAVWSGGFLANAVLMPPKRTPPVQDTVLFSSPGEGNATGEMHLFFSLHCKACSLLLFNLAMENPKQVTWRFSPLDNSAGDQIRLTHILDGKLLELNPFLEILRWEGAETVEEIPVPKMVDTATSSADTWFQNQGHSGIPLLLVREGPGRTMVLTGSENILEYLLEKKVISQILGGKTQEKS